MPIEPNHGPRCLCTCGKSFPSPWPWAKMLMMASPRHLISLPFHITLPLRQIFLWHDSQVIQMVGVNSLSILYHYSFSLCIILCSHLSFVQLSLLNLLIFFNSNSFFSNWSRSCCFFFLLWMGIKGGFLYLYILLRPLQNLSKTEAASNESKKLHKSGSLSQVCSEVASGARSKVETSFLLFCNRCRCWNSFWDFKGPASDW